jgi:hypothetical protein
VDRFDARARRRNWGEALAFAYFLAIVPNSLEAFGAAPDGWVWHGVRIALSLTFVIALFGWLLALVCERRTPPSKTATSQ